MGGMGSPQKAHLSWYEPHAEHFNAPGVRAEAQTEQEGTELSAIRTPTSSLVDSMRLRRLRLQRSA